jgi:hypothetical protein
MSHLLLGYSTINTVWNFFNLNPIYDKKNCLSGKTIDSIICISLYMFNTSQSKFSQTFFDVIFDITDFAPIVAPRINRIDNR